MQKDSPNYFNDSALEIRSLLNKNQLNQFFNYKCKTKVISYHSIHDNIASYEEKETYINLLRSNTIDVNFVKTDLCTNSFIKYNTSENYTYILKFLEDKLDYKIKKPKLK